MKRFVKVYEILTTILTVMVLIMACALVIPRLFGIRPYNVKTGSMEPTISTGALAFINTRDTDAEIGDIMTFKLTSENGNEVLVTHRVIDIKEDGIYFKGDANNAPDNLPVPNENLVGKYLFSIPGIGALVQKINLPFVVMVAGWIILLNFLAMLLNSKYTNKSSTDGKAEDNHGEEE